MLNVNCEEVGGVTFWQIKRGYYNFCVDMPYLNLLITFYYKFKIMRYQSIEIKKRKRFFFHH